MHSQNHGPQIIQFLFLLYKINLKNNILNFYECWTKPGPFKKGDIDLKSGTMPSNVRNLSCHPRVQKYRIKRFIIISNAQNAESVIHPILQFSGCHITYLMYKETVESGHCQARLVFIRDHLII